MMLTDHNTKLDKYIISVLLVLVWTSALIDNSFLLRKILPFGIFKIGSIFFIVYCIIFIMTRQIIIEDDVFFANHFLLLFLITLYWLYSLIGTFYTPRPDWGTEFIAYNIYYIVITLCSIILFFHLPLEYRKKVIGVIGIISFTILVFMSIGIYGLRYYDIISVREISKSVFTVFNDRNVYLFNLILSLQFIFLLFDNKKYRQKYLLLILYIGLLIVIAFIGSISGSARSWGIYFPIATLVILYSFFSNKKSFTNEYSSLTIIFLIFFMAFAVFFLKGRLYHQNFDVTSDGYMESNLLQPLKANIKRSMNLFQNPNDVFSGRTLLWEKACNVFETYSTIELIFGRGTRSYLSDPAFFTNKLKITGKGSTPHNFFLSALLEGGILKAALIILIVIVWFAQIIKNLKYVNLWGKNLILGTFLLWSLSVTISGKDFFNSKIIYLVFMVYAILEKDFVSDSELT